LKPPPLRSEAELHFFLSFGWYFFAQFSIRFVFACVVLLFLQGIVMAVIFSSEELAATDRPPIAVVDLGLVSLGHEFDWDNDADHEFDMSGLECHPILASDLPLNSELSGTLTASS
jgi:hypothetical protein